MLNRLEISNYALIDNVSLKLSDGFTVITGETGAGKSIMLQALNLLLGERADTSVIRQNEKKCFLEAEFDISKLQIQTFFEQHDLDYEKTCIVRREFSSSGKSRCFINDTPVQQSVLKELGERIVSIHSQHQTLQIFDGNFQMDLLDHYADIQNDVQEYRSIYRLYRKKVNEKIELEVKEREARKEKDYLEFLLNELETAKLEEGDLEDMQHKFQRIENAEQINEALSFAQSVFENDSIGPNASLKTLIETFEGLKEFDPKFADLAGRLLSLKIELKDIEAEVGRLNGDADIDPEEAVRIKEKIELVNALLFKHNLSTIEQLIELRNSIAAQLDGIQSVEDDLKKIGIEISALKKDLSERASKLSTQRQKNIASLEEQIREQLMDLAMEEAELKIALSPLDRLGPNGTDEVSFLVKTNKGGQFAALKKVASGGELSRIMLSLMSILARSRALPTLIFDEIDTGVSGEVAAKIAKVFKEMGQHLQLIAISHLPQVAGRGQQHLHVTKQSGNDKTTTTVIVLDGEQRVEQLARMISGEDLTEAAIENAKSLLKSA